MRLPDLPQRWWLAIPILALALGIAAWLSPDDEETAEPLPAATVAAARPPGTPAPGAAPADAHSVPPEPVASQPIADIFAVKTWEPPPPPPVAEAAQEPQAPPLPFRFIGRIVVPGQGTAFMLARDDQVIVARVGQRIGKDYRIEKFENGQLLFRYRPMNIRQSLAVGGTTS